MLALASKDGRRSRASPPVRLQRVQCGRRNRGLRPERGIALPRTRRGARYAGVMSDPDGGGWWALALNMAVQHSGGPLQDLVGEPGIVDGTSQRNRSDQRRQDERGVVWFAGWRQAGEQVEI